MMPIVQPEIMGRVRDLWHSFNYVLTALTYFWALFYSTGDTGQDNGIFFISHIHWFPPDHHPITQSINFIIIRKYFCFHVCKNVLNEGTILK